MLNEFDEREVKLIKEVSDKTGYSYEEIQEAFNNLKQACISIFEEIKRIVKDVYDYLVMKNYKENKEKWEVPIKYKIPEAPFIHNHNLQFARNSI